MSHCGSLYQSSQTTHTTMSSLTTPDGEDDNLVELVETPLPPLKSVFDCPNLELCIVNEWTENFFPHTHNNLAQREVSRWKKHLRM